jgi:hypothetical protein
MGFHFHSYILLACIWATRRIRRGPFLSTASSFCSKIRSALANWRGILDLVATFDPKIACCIVLSLKDAIETVSLPAQ